MTIGILGELCVREVRIQQRIDEIELWQRSPVCKQGTARLICWRPIDGSDASRNVAVFGFTWSKTATKSDLAIKAWSFSATLHDVVAEKCFTEVHVKPKTAMDLKSSPFSASILKMRSQRCRNQQRCVVRGRSGAVGHFVTELFSATFKYRSRWRRGRSVSKWQAARYDCVLRAYGAPSTVGPRPAGLAGRFASPPEIWRP